jgi:tetratricopeptide (TPR) repeat protein
MEQGPDPSRSAAARAHLDRGLRLEQAGNYERALEAYGEALVAAPGAPEQVDARLRTARVYRAMADYPRCVAEAREAVRLADEIGAHDLAAEAMNVEVGALQVQSEYAAADALALQALERAQSPRVRGITLQNLGRSAAERRDFATSDRYFTESIDAFRAAKYDVGLAVALGNAARAALDRGDAERSIEIGRESIAIARRLNALDILLTSIENQAAALVALGNIESAESLLTEALGHFTSARNLLRQAECLEIMGQMSELRTDRETAIRCYTRALELATAAGDPTLGERLEGRLKRVRTTSGEQDARHS